MSSFTFNVQTEWRGDAMIAAMQEAAEAGVTAAAMEGADTAVRMLTAKGEGTGGVIGYVSGGKFKEGTADGAKAIGRKAFASSTPGNPPGARTGTLANSVAFVGPKGMGTPLKAAYGTRLIYGRVHEFGGWISGKGKKLAVPVHPAAQGKRPSDFTLRLIKTKRAAMLVRDVGGKNGRSEIMFVLKDRVFMPARPWLKPSLDRAAGAMATAFQTKAKATFAALAAKFTAKGGA